jgi:hypothetical protein
VVGSADACDRTSARGFNDVTLIRERESGSTTRSWGIASGTLAADGDSARGRFRITGSYRYADGRKGFCDSGPLSWRACRKP